MRPLYQKLNQLISQVYPDYSPEYNIMRGNVVKLTIGDYIYRMPGFLENVNVSIDNSNTSWEILLNHEMENEPDVRQLPHMVTVQCSFKPIMDLLPRRQTWLSPFVPLIVNGSQYLNQNIDNREALQPVPISAAEFRQQGATIKAGPILPQLRTIPPSPDKAEKTIKQAPNPNIITKNTTPQTRTDTIGAGSDEGRRQAAIRAASSNLDNRPKTKKNTNSFLRV